MISAARSATGAALPSADAADSISAARTLTAARLDRDADLDRDLGAGAQALHHDAAVPADQAVTRENEP
jgi:hypothetical protein